MSESLHFENIFLVEYDWNIPKGVNITNLLEFKEKDQILRWTDEDIET